MDRDEGVTVEIVGGPRDGAKGVGASGITERILWRDPSGNVMIHEFAGINLAGHAIYRFVGYEDNAVRPVIKDLPVDETKA